MKRALVLGLLLLVAGCGGGNSKTNDPVQSLPDDAKIREAVQNATLPGKSEFPQPGGKTLEQLANTLQAGPSLAMASSVFTVGDNRMAFGVIAKDGVPVYGKTAVYVAPTPNDPAQGPFLAPADVASVQTLLDSLSALSRKVTACVEGGGKLETCQCSAPRELSNLGTRYESVIKQHPAWKDQNLSYQYLDKDKRNMSGVLAMSTLRRQIDMLRCQ